jgi:hypothetical protein
VKQAMNTANHLLKAFEPFSKRAMRENQARGAGQAARAMIGITPAPA